MFSPDAGRSIPGRLAAFLARAAEGDRAGAAGLISPDLTTAAAVTHLFSRILAEGYARLGLKDDALLWLQRAVERGFINHPFLAQHDPWLAPLRGDPQFAALLASVRERSRRFEV